MALRQVTPNQQLPKISNDHANIVAAVKSSNNMAAAATMPQQEQAPTSPQQQPQHPTVVIISIEAAIGTGKSSLLRMLQRRTRDGGDRAAQEESSSSSSSSSSIGDSKNWKWVFVQEPVEMWQDVRRFNSRAAAAAADSSASSTVSSPIREEELPQQKEAEAAAATTTASNDEDFNLLGKFYQSPPDFAYKLQSWAVLSRIETVAKVLEDITRDFATDGRPVVLVLERSWDSDRNTFATMHRDTGNMSPMEWVMYDQMYAFAARNSPSIDGHVYLECSADTCMQRLKKRDRTEEAGVSEDYQRKLIRRHEEWLDTCRRDAVLRLGVDEEFLNNETRANWIFNEICSFAESFFDAKKRKKDSAVDEGEVIYINGAKVRVQPAQQ